MDPGQFEGKKIVVTGASGQIGAALVRSLLTSGAHVFAILQDKMKAHKLLGTNKNLRVEILNLQYASGSFDVFKDADIVFHLAGPHNTRDAVENNYMAQYQAIVIDYNVISSCIAYKVKKLIYASSAGVYPVALQTRNILLCEEMVRIPYAPDGVFGWTKLTGEMLTSQLKSRNSSAISCRLFSVYSPDSEKNAISKWISQALKNEVFELWGAGDQYRSWLYIDDAVDGLLMASQISCEYDVINLASPEVLTIRESISRVALACGIKPKFKRRPELKAGPKYRVADISRAAAFGWQPKISFDEGIKLMTSISRNA